jgi:hypothetical protein
MQDSDQDSNSGLGLHRGMLDHSKLALCMFMLSVAAFNPMGALFSASDDSADYSTSQRGRTMLGVESRFLSCFGKYWVLFRFFGNSYAVLKKKLNIFWFI